MCNNHFAIKVTGGRGVSVTVGGMLDDLGVKLIGYKSHCWDVETEYSKDDLLARLNQVVTNETKVEIEEM